MVGLEYSCAEYVPSLSAGKGRERNLRDSVLGSLYRASLDNLASCELASVGPEGFADCGQQLLGTYAQRFDAGHGRCWTRIYGLDGPAALARGAED